MMLISLPLNLFTVSALCLLFAYFATRIGNKEASWENWYVVVAIAVLVFCLGIDSSVWHLLAGIPAGR